jgi:hypothetical protein
MKNDPGKNYQTMKVFDCQWDPGMPKDVKKAFFEITETGNDVYVSWTVQADGSYSDDDTDEITKNLKLVDNWLIENGAEGRSEQSPYDGETVLIKHWW